MIQQYKIDKVNEFAAKLQDKKNIILTNYSGLNVKDIDQLRDQLRDKGVVYKVIKNTLFKRALMEKGYQEVGEYFKGPIAVAFTEKDLSEAAKIFKNFKKDHENFNFTLGILDNVVYDEVQIKRIADIPSKEVLISQIMSCLNSPATKLAMVVNQVTASLARAIKAVAEKNAE
jgi:large subunit ribosomal protein L10